MGGWEKGGVRVGGEEGVRVGGDMENGVWGTGRGMEVTSYPYTYTLCALVEGETQYMLLISTCHLHPCYCLYWGIIDMCTYVNSLQLPH